MAVRGRAFLSEQADNNRLRYNKDGLSGAKPITRPVSAMTNYRRNFIPGGSFFFTVNLAERRLRLLTEHIDLLREAFRRVRRRHPIPKIDAIVVLPDHLHAIWTLPGDDADFALRWRLIKSTSSHGLHGGERISKSRAAKGERGIWQRRYWEHTLGDETASLATPTIFTTIRSSMAMSTGFGTGRLHRFIGWSGSASIRSTGPAMPLTMQRTLASDDFTAVELLNDVASPKAIAFQKGR